MHKAIILNTNQTFCKQMREKPVPVRKDMTFDALEFANGCSS